MTKCNNCGHIFDGCTDDECPYCGSDDVEEIELRQDVVDFVLTDRSLKIIPKMITSTIRI